MDTNPKPFASLLDDLAGRLPIDTIDPQQWTSRLIDGERMGTETDPPAWLSSSYQTLRDQVMDPAYPCFFGTMAEKRGEMFYGFVRGKRYETMVKTMRTFAALSAMPRFRKFNIAIFFEPDALPLPHESYHDLFWRTLQHLHDVDEDPDAPYQPPPSDEAWEFGYAGLQMFVVCACPSFRLRHSRNLGPGMVLLFQPRAVFVDTITNKVIGREARQQVRKRLETWDDVTAHPDLGFYGDPGNLEWRQYFLPDANSPSADRCPFLSRIEQSRRKGAREGGKPNAPARRAGAGEASTAGADNGHGAPAAVTAHTAGDKKTVNHEGWHRNLMQK
ncbi:YqcI/YcgG family protein [Robbsia andropogonis]|uniref:YqcI/YcgG family protein n=1 Tax=Robbsia andropogonis TaxID=28092 RepID=UPI0004B4EE11|nr:YqcI/YcgG family protein [Robbsia andropogonis]